MLMLSLCYSLAMLSLSSGGAASAAYRQKWGASTPKRPFRNAYLLAVHIPDRHHLGVNLMTGSTQLADPGRGFYDAKLLPAIQSGQFVSLLQVIKNSFLLTHFYASLW